MSASSPVVITIARQLGSGGSYLGQQVARQLGFAYADREILERAAHELGCTANDLTHCEERLAGFWSRLAAIFSVGAPEHIYTPPPLLRITENQVFETEQRIMLRLAERASCVIVGHGGFYFLRRHRPLLNVFVHAGTAFRRRRIMELYHVTRPDEADDMLADSDRQRERYIHNRTGLDWTDARNYHLSIATDRIDFEQATAWIVKLVRQPDQESPGNAADVPGPFVRP